MGGNLVMVGIVDGPIGRRAESVGLGFPRRWFRLLPAIAVLLGDLDCGADDLARRRRNEGRQLVASHFAWLSAKPIVGLPSVRVDPVHYGLLPIAQHLDALPG